MHEVQQPARTKQQAGAPQPAGAQQQAGTQPIATGQQGEGVQQVGVLHVSEDSGFMIISCASGMGKADAQPSQRFRRSDGEKDAQTSRGFTAAGNSQALRS